VGFMGVSWAVFDLFYATESSASPRTPAGHVMLVAAADDRFRHAAVVASFERIGLPSSPGMSAFGCKAENIYSG
jgi:hypothetical protein